MVSGDRTLWPANWYKNPAFPIHIRIPSFLSPTTISTTTFPSPLSASLLILRLLALPGLVDIALDRQLEPYAEHGRPSTIKINHRLIGSTTADRHVKISFLPFRDYGLDELETRNRLSVKYKIPAIR
jgi:hypothetical protein